MGVARFSGAWLLVLGLTFAASASPQTYTRAQIEAMDEASANRLSYLAMIRAFEPARVGAHRFLVQRGLAQLGYGSFGIEDASDEQLREAAGAFQRRIGAPVSGELTVEQVRRVNEAVKLLSSPPINLGPKRVRGVEGYVVAEGTWTEPTEGHAIPLNSARIECSQEKRICTESFSYVDLGSGLISLHSFINEYQIMRWTSTEIQAEIAHLCVTNTLYIDTRAKRVTMLRRSRSDSTCSAEQYVNSKVFALDDGSEIGRLFTQRRFQSGVLDIINPALWSRYESTFR